MLEPGETPLRSGTRRGPGHWQGLAERRPPGRATGTEKAATPPAEARARGNLKERQVGRARGRDASENWNPGQGEEH